MAEFKQMLLGRTLPRQHAKYFGFTLALFVMGCILSQIFYPGGYSITEYYISNQGWIAENPMGCWFFIFGTGIAGILLIPHFLYMHRLLLPTAKFFVYLSTLSSIAGSIGLSMVGFVTKDEVTDSIHDFAADLAFIGLGIGAGFSLLVLIRKICLKEDWPNLEGFLILFTGTLGMGLALVLVDDNQLQQWMGLFSMLTWLIGTFILTLKSDPKQRTN